MVTAPVPDNPFIFELFRKKKVPIHIVRHSVKVYQVSKRLCSLMPKDLDLDFRLIEASALLHDICKIDSIKNGGDHAKKGGKFLRDLGYPQVGEIIRQHVFLDRPVSYYSGLREEIIVNYADKRVKHTQVVSLRERFEDIVVRYAKSEETEERIWKLFKESQRMEKLIFRYLPVGPEAI